MNKDILETDSEEHKDINPDTNASPRSGTETDNTGVAKSPTQNSNNEPTQTNLNIESRRSTGSPNQGPSPGRTTTSPEQRRSPDH